MDRIADHGEARPQSARLLGQTCGIPIGGKRLDHKAVRIAQQQIDGVLPDRSGRAEDRDATRSIAARLSAVARVHCHARMLRPSIRVSRATSGTTASRPSSLSRSPP